jgi:hypothetical protein
MSSIRRNPILSELGLFNYDVLHGNSLVTTNFSSNTGNVNSISGIQMSFQESHTQNSYSSQVVSNNVSSNSVNAITVSGQEAFLPNIIIAMVRRLHLPP